MLKVNPAGRGRPKLAELATLLNLKPGEERYELVVAAGVPDPAKNPTEPVAALRVTPLSTAQALFFLANGVEIPPEHPACQLVRLSADGADPAGATRRVFRVHCPAGHERKPTDLA